MKLDPIEDAPLDMLVHTANDLIDQFQDDREIILEERQNAVDQMKPLRNCLCFCDLHLRAHTAMTPVNVDSLTDAQLIERVQHMCIKLDATEFSGRFIQKAPIEDILKGCKQYIESKGNLIDFLQCVINRYLMFCLYYMIKM